MDLQYLSSKPHLVCFFFFPKLSFGLKKINLNIIWVFKIIIQISRKVELDKTNSVSYTLRSEIMFYILKIKVLM